MGGKSITIAKGNSEERKIPRWGEEKYNYVRRDVPIWHGFQKAVQLWI